jgi:vacuolar-type H+-ATPase subunit H
MTPVLNTIVGAGRLMSSSVEINNSKTFEKIGDILKNDKLKILSLNNLDVDFEVRNGRVYIKPFDIKLGQKKLNISGDQGIDETMNYTMLMNIPRSELGTGAGSALDGLTSLASQQGLALDFGDAVDISFLVGGTFLNPQVKPLFGKGTGTIGGQVQEQVKERVTEEVEQVKQDVREQVNEKADLILKEAEVNAQKVSDEAKRAGDELVKVAETQGQRLIKEAGTNPIKKRIAEESVRKLKSEAEDKAQKLEEEANKRADQILNEARAKADQLK